MPSMSGLERNNRSLMEDTGTLKIKITTGGKCCVGGTTQTTKKQNVQREIGDCFTNECINEMAESQHPLETKDESAENFESVDNANYEKPTSFIAHQAGEHISCERNIPPACYGAPHGVTQEGHTFDKETQAKQHAQTLICDSVVEVGCPKKQSASQDMRHFCDQEDQDDFVHGFAFMFENFQAYGWIWCAMKNRHDQCILLWAVLVAHNRDPMLCFDAAVCLVFLVMIEHPTKDIWAAVRQYLRALLYIQLAKDPEALLALKQYALGKCSHKEDLCLPKAEQTEQKPFLSTKEKIGDAETHAEEQFFLIDYVEDDIVFDKQKDEHIKKSLLDDCLWDMDKDSFFRHQIQQRPLGLKTAIADTFDTVKYLEEAVSNHEVSPLCQLFQQLNRTMPKSEHNQHVKVGSDDSNRPEELSDKHSPIDDKKNKSEHETVGPPQKTLSDDPDFTDERKKRSPDDDKDRSCSDGSNPAGERPDESAAQDDKENDSGNGTLQIPKEACSGDSDPPEEKPEKRFPLGDKENNSGPETWGLLKKTDSPTSEHDSSSSGGGSSSSSTSLATSQGSTSDLPFAVQCTSDQEATMAAQELTNVSSQECVYPDFLEITHFRLKVENASQQSVLSGGNSSSFETPYVTVVNFVTPQPVDSQNQTPPYQEYIPIHSPRFPETAPSFSFDSHTDCAPGERGAACLAHPEDESGRSVSEERWLVMTERMEASGFTEKMEHRSSSPSSFSSSSFFPSQYLPYLTPTAPTQTAESRVVQPCSAEPSSVASSDAAPSSSGVVAVSDDDDDSPPVLRLPPVVVHAAGALPPWATTTARIDLSRAVNREKTQLKSRRATYDDDWPYDSGIDPANMALSGFFHTGPGRRVRCFYCGLELDPESRDNIWDEHVRHSPGCAYLLAVMGEDSVQETQTKLRDKQHQ